MKAGGSAVDAAVAIQTVLGLVEPQKFRPGGGAFLVYYDAKTHQVAAYDGREIAPMGATKNLFFDDDGKPLRFSDVVLGGRSTGVPGAIAMLELAQKQHGRLPWVSRFKQAHDLATKGFVVSPRLARMIQSSAPQASAPDVVRYCTKPDGTRYAAGDILRNPAYAGTLNRIAASGAAGLLTGSVAVGMVERLRQTPSPSSRTLADLSPTGRMLDQPFAVRTRSHRLHAASPVRRPWVTGSVKNSRADRYRASQREGFSGLVPVRPGQPPRLCRSRRYVGDPTFVRVPIKRMLAPDYLRWRAQLIGNEAGKVTFGTSVGAPNPGVDATAEPGGTSHFVIVDARGNAVSMTSTVESLFGSGRMLDGFFLNN